MIEMKMIAIRQPGYFPYTGFFKKIQACDEFVIFDDAQYAIRSWDNRNLIKTNQGSEWITVPVKNPFKKKISEVEINNNIDWKRKNKNAIKANYGKSKFFNDYWPELEAIIEQKWEKLSELNIELINHFRKILDIKTPIFLSSETDTDGKSSEKLLNICLKQKADVYLSGINGKAYLDTKIFDNHKIKVIFENFIHPKYTQINGEFLENMSIIDLIFNEGDNAKEILKNTQNIIENNEGIV
jgi:hypothetical protein